MRSAIFAVVVLGLAASGSAQTTASRAGGWGAGSAINKLWNPSTEVTFKGRITGVQRSEPFKGMDPGVALLVRNDRGGGTAMVEMGPSWFIDNQSVKLRLRDRVEVTGSKVIVNGKSSILARKIVKDNRVLYLRGTDGFPMWIASRGHVTVGRVASRTPPPTIVPVTGEVIEIGSIRILDNAVPNTVLVVRGENNTLYTVDLGPSWFVSRQDVAFRVGDALVIDAVRGPGQLNSAPVYLANTVRRGNEFLILRYDNGRAVWEAWGG